MKLTRFCSMIVLNLFCFLGLMLLSAPKSYAQSDKFIKGDLTIPDSTHTQILVLLDGSRFMGRIVETGESEIQFETSLGRMTIPLSKIKKIQEVPTSAIKNGKYWFPNPNSTRLYFAPTARNLKQGEGYFADYFLFFPGIAYGMTDNITVGGGISLIPGVNIDEQIFYFTPKVGVQIAKNLNLATGTLIIRVPDFSDDNDSPATAGILYTVGTYGTPDASITAGFGYGFAGSELADKPMVMLGGEKRLSRRIALVTENWIFPEVANPLVSYGFRFMGESLSVDLALYRFWIYRLLIVYNIANP